MTRLFIKRLASLSDERFEVYWLAGFEQNEKNEWFVRVVLRALESGRVYMERMPIGLLPILSLGMEIERGEFKTDHARGEIWVAAIGNVAQGELITSAEISPQLYPFEGHKAGVQRLLRYRSNDLDILIPVVELIRYLFLHNRTLAHAMMRPSAINLLFHPEKPAYQDSRLLKFTSEMPHQSLNQRFVKEFAWLALDPEARRAWDSIYDESAGQDYVMFSPPSVTDSAWRFRGVQHNGQWLVLELLSLSGRRVPCRELWYSHPRFRHALRADEDGGVPAKHSKARSDVPSEHVRYIYELDEGENGSTADHNRRWMYLFSKSVDFDNSVKVMKHVEDVQLPFNVHSNERNATIRRDGPVTKVIKVTASERSDTGTLPPLDFKLLSPAKAETLGNLSATSEAIHCIRDLLPHIQIATVLVELKQTRTFSKIGKHPRPAFVAMIRASHGAPTVLLDVERSGVPALSMMALRFGDTGITDDEIHKAVQQTLDGLVDSGGYWDRTVEEKLNVLCRSQRLPKYLVPREDAVKGAKLWARRLIAALELQ